MNEENIKTRASILAESIAHIQKFKNKIIVIKYGGNAISSRELQKSVAKDIVWLNYIGIKVVVVHGGGPFITGLSDALKIETNFINGLRYSDENTIDVILQAMCGKVNKLLVQDIESNFGNAIGLSGIDNSLITAKQKDPNLGLVGEVTKVNTNLIKMMLDNNLIPVISTIGLSEDKKQIFNVNGDECASAIASELNAQKLILLTDVCGILKDRNDNDTLISEVNISEINELISNEVISGGMIPKVKSCEDAIKNGVNETHIIDGTLTNSLILELLSDNGIGTMIKGENNG